MEKFKKGINLIESGTVPEFFGYIEDGKLTEGNVIYNTGSFFGVLPFIMKMPVNNDYKTFTECKINIYKNINEIPEEIRQAFLKEISKNLNSLIYYPIIKKFPDPEEVFSAKVNHDNIDKEIEFSGNDEFENFFQTFDFLMINDDVEIPENFEDFKEEVKNMMLEFNVSKYLVLIRKGFDRFHDENWKDFINEVFDQAVVINDRALALYSVYLMAMISDDIAEVNAIIRKNWEFLRFNGLNTWIDYAMRFLNNNLFYSDGEIQ